MMLGRFGLPRLPKASVNHIKYPVIDSSAFQQAVDYQHAFDETETMHSFKWSGLRRSAYTLWPGYRRKRLGANCKNSQRAFDIHHTTSWRAGRPTFG